MSYYYLLSSLPCISLESKPPISLDAFRASCADQLSAGDQRALEGILEKDLASVEHAHPFVAEWNARETQLRNASARLRAAKRQTDAGPFVRAHTGFDVAIEERVEDAFSQATPLAREQALDQIRWNVLDELVGPEPFSAAAVLAYGVKLQMTERWAAMDSTLGRARIDTALTSNNEAGAADETAATA
jgi:hypothetical protein